MYTTTVSDYVQKGYAKEVTKIETGNNHVWYLPHHPVTNPNKPGKVRVVFDCVAMYKGMSLNSQLLQGPDLMNSLVGVLTRFRQEHVALAADIEAMFHQVRVHDEDCDALRFLWWPRGDLNRQPKCYRMQVHLFGATSSPSCTAYALRRTASDHAHMYESEVVETIRRNFYVDDCLKSVSSEERAITLASDLQSLMQRGGFRLTKWLSNNRNVVDSIPESERAPSIKNLAKGDNLPLDRALGVHWDIARDEIRFKVKLSEKPLTRRGILSTVSSLFDPLGLVCPVLLPAKAIVQKLCKEKIGWDDRISEKWSREWRQWLNALPALEKVAIKRCFKPQGFGQVRNAQLHVFCDGSELGYGACAYIRLADEHGKIACSLIMGKSRLAPIKQTSIPRLELSGAVVASRLYGLIKHKLEIDIDNVIFWTDSMIVLGYIKNETRRFKTFVGNRLGQIHKLTSPEQWRHVDTHSNPADLASRGIEAYDLKGLSLWLNGPDFLLKDEGYWPVKRSAPDIDETDTEVKRKITINATTCDIDKVINYYSDWTALRRAVAWFTRFVAYCSNKYLKRKTECNTGELTVCELLNATHVLLCLAQNDHFKDEIKSLQNNTGVKKSSNVASLNPTLQNGLIRIRGRVTKQNQQSIILPCDHHVTKLIISHYHRNLGHVGTQQVLAAVREKYWIIKGHATVKKVLSSCVTCKRVHGPWSSQQMAPLLDEQMTADMPPFTFVGIDYFGPFTVKLGRARVNRYGCIFTCRTSRAVHFEIAHSLTTSSFIAAFQRFESRRGRPRKVYSDNGTNLVGGEHELRSSIDGWNQSKISRHFTQNEIEWHFNPPQASHMGGAWERLIRSTRLILRSIVSEQLLNDEQLLTFMAEAEKILNDRPLTPVSSDPRDPLALTPNMVLLMKSNRCLPVGVFNKDDVYAKRWWKQIQYLADVFWRRWLREYLPLLQKRQKWQRKITNVKKGDVVLVASDHSPRGQWPLARVDEVNYGRDGLVRSCVIKTPSGQLVRPVTKLCVLESSV